MRIELTLNATVVSIMVSYFQLKKGSYSSKSLYYLFLQTRSSVLSWVGLCNPFSRMCCNLIGKGRGGSVSGRTFDLNLYCTSGDVHQVRKKPVFQFCIKRRLCYIVFNDRERRADATCNFCLQITNEHSRGIKTW